MTASSRHQRLLDDQEILTALAAQSTILRLEASGEPPDRYTLEFHGQGLARETGAQAEVQVALLHRIELRMPYSYPESAPDIRWLTPLWHPNVSFSGLVNLSDAGIAWSPEVSLGSVCERLWDMIRGAFVNPQRSTNYAAKTWFEQPTGLVLPVDPRPLCDLTAGGGTNIVRYQRLAGRATQFAHAAAPGEVIFIGEDTPTPTLPQRRPYVPAGRRPEGEEPFYIGPE